MASSLDNLVKNLAKTNKEAFHLTKKEFGDNLDVMLRKGVYPYDYMDHEDRFDD